MKRFFVPLLFFFSAPLAFADFEPLPDSARPRNYIQLDIGRTPNRGIERRQTYGGAEYNFAWEPFGGFFGFQCDGRIADLTLKTDYLPIVSRHENGAWRFGAAATYHQQRFFDSYREHDILQEIEARWTSAKGLTFTARTGWSWRITTFDAIENFCITDGDVTAYVEIDKRWKTGIEIFTSLGSYNLYRYPLFFCPQWTFGAAWTIKSALRLGAAVEIGMTDFYASVAYINHVLFRWSLGVLF